MPKAFPKTIYVTREADADGSEYFNVHTDAETKAFAETTVVAVYDLTSMGRVEVTREFRWGDLKTAQKAAIKRSRRAR